MQNKFTVPQTVEEFKERAKPITAVGAANVIQAHNKKLEKITKPLKDEITFFEQVVEYKKTGVLPEGLRP
jgi:hypothetical protein